MRFVIELVMAWLSITMFMFAAITLSCGSGIFVPTMLALSGFTALYVAYIYSIAA